MRMDKTKVIFLDRDGTIIKDKGYMYRPEDIEFEDGAVSALRRIQGSHLLIVVTNQSGIGRGMFTMDDYSNFNSAFVDKLSTSGVAIKMVFCCPHAPDSNCNCRKPRIDRVCEWLESENIVIDKNNSYVIGDKESDVEFGRNLGIRCFLISRGKDADIDGCRIVRNLSEAVETIV